MKININTSEEDLKSGWHLSAGMEPDFFESILAQAAWFVLNECLKNSYLDVIRADWNLEGEPEFEGIRILFDDGKDIEPLIEIIITQDDMLHEFEAHKDDPEFQEYVLESFKEKRGTYLIAQWFHQIGTKIEEYAASLKRKKK